MSCRAFPRRDRTPRPCPSSSRPSAFPSWPTGTTERSQDGLRCPDSASTASGPGEVGAEKLQARSLDQTSAYIWGVEKGGTKPAEPGPFPPLPFGQLQDPTDVDLRGG